MDIVLATGNSHKKEELQAIFQEHTLLLPCDLKLVFACEETGTTFLENSILKAKTLYGKIRRPVMADDSGLCIEFLNGAPGLYSSRFGEDAAGRELSFDEKIALVLEKMRKADDRSAYFICCMVLMVSTERLFIVQETMEGEIIKTPRGTGGFGYDPIFQPKGHTNTMAEIGVEIKNRISHRGKASRVILSIIDNYESIFET